MGYGVLPFALEQDCLMAFSIDKDGSSVHVRHTDEARFPE
jgi:hypothetical protein